MDAALELDPETDIASDPRFPERYMRVQNTVRSATEAAAAISPQQKMQLCQRDIRLAELQLGEFQARGNLTADEKARQRSLQYKLMVLYLGRQRIEIQLFQARSMRFYQFMDHLGIPEEELINFGF